MIVDVHTHLNNYHESQAVPLATSLARLEKSMRVNRVDYALILTSYKESIHRPSTRQVLDAIEGRSHLSVVAGISMDRFQPVVLKELAEFARSGRIKGFKLYPGYEHFYPTDRRCRRIYELAEKWGLPVMIHTGDTYTPRGKLKYAHPLHVDDIAVDHPGVRFVICHLGNPWIRDCMEIVYKNRNVYADISGLMLGDEDSSFERYMLEDMMEMIAYAGEPQYLLYGSDWPLASMKSYRAMVRHLPLPKKEKEMILWKNAFSLFKLTDVSGEKHNR